MNSSDLYKYEVIEQYLSGALPEDERKIFEEKLKSDDLLKQKVQVCQVSRNAILQNKLKDLKLIMAEESSKADKAISLNKFWFIGIALLLGVSLYFYFTYKNSDSTEKRVTEKSGESISFSSDSAERKSEPTENKLPRRIEKTLNDLQTIRDEKILEKETHAVAVDSSNVTLNNTTQNIPVVKKDSVKITTEKQVNPCKGVVISAEPTLYEPCAGMNDGHIELSDLKGGKEPYTVSINGEPQGNKIVFNGLSSGSYQVIVTDHNGCTHQFNTLILKGKDCVQRYDFNPGRGEEWQGPIVEESRLTIMNKAGVPVYTRQMSDGEQCTWNGYNQSGVLMHGYFIFTIENKDGNVIKGSITVTE